MFVLTALSRYALDTQEALATPEHAAPLGAFCTQTPHHHCPTTRLLRAVPLSSPICDLGSPRPRITPSASLVSYSTCDAQHCNGTHEVVPTLPRHAHLCAAAFSMVCAARDAILTRVSGTPRIYHPIYHFPIASPLIRVPRRARSQQHYNLPPHPSLSPSTLDADAVRSAGPPPFYWPSHQLPRRSLTSSNECHPRFLNQAIKVPPIPSSFSDAQDARRAALALLVPSSPAAAFDAVIFLIQVVDLPRTSLPLTNISGHVRGDLILFNSS
ncbi:hypothetical protein C8J57DRAFT_1501922 [Mycena rebaudengoi]|nr:hypothetical protein C8J57DRAFT_1501922 [Mycena rebaudengoi]